MFVSTYFLFIHFNRIEIQHISSGRSLFHFLFSSSYGSVLDGRDLVLDHGAHWVNLEWLSFLWLLFLLFENLVVLNWGLWLRVLSGIGDNGRVSFDSSLVHWDFLFLFLLLFLLCWFLILLFVLFGGFLVFAILLLLLIGLLLFLLLFLLGFLFFFFFFLWSSVGSISCLSILLHIFSKGLDEVIREAGTELNGLRLLYVAGSQKGSDDKCRRIFH